MPRKAKYVPMDKTKRFRITVELDPVSVAILESWLQQCRSSGVNASLSQLVRFAISAADLSGGLMNVKLESLDQIRKRLELRSITRTEQ